MRAGRCQSVIGGQRPAKPAQAFTHGYHVAVGVGAICVLAAAVPALLGFRLSPAAAPAEALPAAGRHSEAIVRP
ncbi:MAG TPA: hypothetical protein VHT26_06305 [Trebonia sp.]|jgi:hypothetical protein|nr:hypothetical protein [Trebonia sp.]